MKFKIRRASGTSSVIAPCDGAMLGSDGYWYISLMSMEKLAKFISANGSIIINPETQISGKEPDSTLTIVIYDDYVE
jgi:hypothetical protein